MENKQFFKGLNKSLKTVVCSAVALAITTYMTNDVQAASFNDTLGHWAENQIDRWAGEGVLEGFNGYYRPNDPITRAEMAVILNKIMDYQIESSTYYSDLGGSEWYTSYVRKLNAAGFMEGADGQIRPYDNITREEAAVVIANAFHYDVPSTTSGVINTVFTDNIDIAYWAKNSVNVLYQNGVISGRGGNYFDPKSNVTRAEVAQMLDNIVSTFVHERQDITNTVVNGNMVINEPGTTLTNVTINGNLILAEGIADGDIDLTNVTVTGNIIIKGGSTGTIYVEDVTIQGRLEVSRVDAPTLVTIRGKSSIPVIDIYHNCVVDATELDDGYSLGDVTIYGKDNVTILGKVDSIVNKSPNLNLTVSGTIGSIYMESNGTVNGDGYGAGSYVDTTKIPGTSATGAPYVYATSNFPSSGSATIVVDEPTFDEETGEVKVFVYVSSIKNCAIMSEPQNAITLPEGSKISSIDVEMTKDGEDTFGTYVYEVVFTVTGTVSTVELDVNFKTDSGAPDITLVKNFDDVTSGEGTASANITDTVVDDETGEVTVTIIVSNMVNCRLPGTPSKAITVAVPEGEDEDDYPSIISVVEGDGSTSTITAYEVTFLPSSTQDTFPLQVNFLDGSDDSDYSNMAVNLTQVFPAYDEEEDKATAVTTVSAAIDDEDNELTYFYIYVSEMVNCTLPTDLTEAITLQGEDDETELTITLVSSGSDARTYKVSVPYDEDRTELDLYLNYITASNVDGVSVSVVTNPEIEDANLTFARWESEEGSNTIKGVIVASSIDGYNLKVSSDAAAIVSVEDEDTVTDFEVDFYVGNNNIFEVTITPADDIEEVVLVVEYEAISAVEEGAPTITSSTYYNNVVDASVATVRTEITRYVASTGATTMTVSVPTVSATAQLVDGLTNAFKLSGVTNFAIVDNEDSTYTVTFNTAEADATLNLNVYFETFSYSDGTYKLYTRAGGGSINCYLVPAGTSVGSTTGGDVESNSVVAIRANVSDSRYYVVPSLTSDSPVTLQPNHSFVMPDSDVTVTAITYALPSDGIKYSWSAAYATGSINTVYNGSFGLVDVATGEIAYYMEAGKEYDLHCFVPDGYSFVGYRYGGEDITGNRITATADKTAFTVIVVRGTSYAVTKDASSEDFTLLSGSTTVATPATIMENTQLQIVADADKTEKVEFSTDGGSTWTEIVYNDGYFHTVTGATSFKVTYKGEVPTEDVFSDITNDDERVGITVDADDVDDDDNVKAGASVTVTITPEEGKVVDTVKVLDSEGDDISDSVGLTGPNAEGDYTFTMPSFDCEVDVTYKDAAVDEEEEEEDTYTLGKHDSNNDFTITDADGAEVSSVVGTTTVTIVPDTDKNVDKVYYFQATEDNEWKELAANADGSYTFEVSADTRFQVTYEGEPERFELYYYDKVLVSGVEDVQTLTYTKNADTGNIQVVATLPSDWEKDKYELRTTSPLVIDTDPPSDTGVTTTIVTDPVLNETMGTVTFTVNVDATTLLTDVTVTFNLFFTEVSEENYVISQSADSVAVTLVNDDTGVAIAFGTEVEVGTKVRVVPATGENFQLVLANSEPVTQENGNYVFSMPANNVTIYAVYETQMNEYGVIQYVTNGEDGILSATGVTDFSAVPANTVVTLTPATGEQFSSVVVKEVSGAIVTPSMQTADSVEFTMPESYVIIEVTYAEEAYSIVKAENSLNFTVSVDGENFDYGNEKAIGGNEYTVTATGAIDTATQKYQITVDGISLFADSFTFTMPTSRDVSVKVEAVDIDTTTPTVISFRVKEINKEIDATYSVSTNVANGTIGADTEFTVTLPTAAAEAAGYTARIDSVEDAVLVSGTTYKVNTDATNVVVYVIYEKIDVTTWTLSLDDTLPDGSEPSSNIVLTTASGTLSDGDTISAEDVFTITQPVDTAYSVERVVVTGAELNNGFYTPTGNVVIYVVYEKIVEDLTTEYNIALTAPDSNIGSATVDKTVASLNSSVTVTPTVVDSGYKFVYLTVTSTDDATKSFVVYDTSFLMPAYDVTITVHFAQLHTITTKEVDDSQEPVAATPAVVMVNGVTATKAVEDDKVTVNIEPLSGYTLQSVTVAGVTLEKVSTYAYSFNMPNQDVEIVIVYTVSTSSNELSKKDETDGFTLSVDGNQVSTPTNVDENKLVYVYPESGKTIGRVEVNGATSLVSKDTDGNYYFRMPSYQAEVDVFYAYELTAVGDPVVTGGTQLTMPDGSVVYQVTEGDSISITGKNNGNVAKIVVSDDTTGTVNQEVTSSPLTFVMPESDVTVTVTYQYEVTTTDNVDGSTVSITSPSIDGDSKYIQTMGETVVFNVTTPTGSGLTYAIPVLKNNGVEIQGFVPTQVLGTNMWSFPMPDNAVLIDVTYSGEINVSTVNNIGNDVTPDGFTLTGSQSGDITSLAEAVVGETITVNFGTVTGYEFSRLLEVTKTTDDSAIVGLTGANTFVMPAYSVDLKVTYYPDPAIDVELTVEAGSVSNKDTGDTASLKDTKIELKSSTDSYTVVLEVTDLPANYDLSAVTMTAKDEDSDNNTTTCGVTMPSNVSFDRTAGTITFTLTGSLNESSTITIDVEFAEAALTFDGNWNSGTVKQTFAQAGIPKIEDGGYNDMTIDLSTVLTGDKVLKFTDGDNTDLDCVEVAVGAGTVSNIDYDDSDNSLTFDYTPDDEDRDVVFNIVYGYEVTVDETDADDVGTSTVTVTPYTGYGDARSVEVLEGGYPIFVETNETVTLLAVVKDANYEPTVGRDDTEWTRPTDVLDGATWKYTYTETISGTHNAILNIVYSGKTYDLTNVNYQVVYYDEDKTSNVDGLTGSASAKQDSITNKIVVTFMPTVHEKYLFNASSTSDIIIDIAVAGVTVTDTELESSNLTLNADGSYSFTIEGATEGLAGNVAITFDVLYEEINLQGISVSNGVNNGVSVVLKANGVTLSPDNNNWSTVVVGDTIKVEVTNMTLDNFEDYTASNIAQFLKAFNGQDSVDISTSQTPSVDDDLEITFAAPTSNNYGATFSFEFTMPAYPLNLSLNSIYVPAKN